MFHRNMCKGRMYYEQTCRACQPLGTTQAVNPLVPEFHLDRGALFTESTRRLRVFSKISYIKRYPRQLDTVCISNTRRKSLGARDESEDYAEWRFRIVIDRKVRRVHASRLILSSCTKDDQPQG